MSMTSLIILWAGLAMAGSSPDLSQVLPQEWSQPSGGARSQAIWWPALGEPSLDALVQEGLSDNRDLLTAWAQAQQAGAMAAQAGSALSPSLSFDLGTNTAPLSSRGFAFGGLGGEETSGVYHTGSAKLGASWELDLWGKNTLGYRASRLDARAAEGDVDAIAQSLAARITSAWLDVVAARERSLLTAEQIEDQTELLELMELRHRGGEATALEVLQQRQQLASVQALAPTWRSQERAGRWALAVLVGRSSDAHLELPDALPTLPEAPALGAPADLAESRPDLRSATSRLDAARARRHQAERSVLPTLKVSGSAGWEGYREEELLTQETWGVGTSASVPLFAGGAGWAGIRGARAAEEAALQSWTSAMLGAVQEVESSLAREQEQRLRLQAVAAQQEAASMAHTEALTRYREGVGSYQPVYTTMGAWQQARLSLVDARRAALAEYIALQLALGGTWTEELSP